jgi:RNA polymerase-binding protein DksA
VSANHDDLRARLTEERDQLLHRIDELTAGGHIQLDYDDDFADRGQVASEQGENRVLADNLQHQLAQVDKALARLDEGTYGTCEVCGAVIGDERLELMPTTARCIDHA